MGHFPFVEIKVQTPPRGHTSLVTFHVLGFEVLRDSVVNGNYSTEGKEWSSISESAKDLLRRMLTVDPKRRITIAEILTHPWLKNKRNPVNFDSTYFGRIKGKEQCSLRGRVRDLMVDA